MDNDGRERGAGPGGRILVVDDDHDFAETIADVLELKGLLVDRAHSGEEGLELFRKHDYAAVLLDVKLPGMNGLECFQAMRRIQSDARVIMMTGYSVEQILDQALAEGVWKVLTKPFDLGRVVAMLSALPRDGVVLVVDDDPDLTATLRDLLAAKGYRVLVATTGEQALALVRQHSIDLMILDLQLPMLHGLAVYREIRAEGYLFPTMIVTAYPSEEQGALDVLRTEEATSIFVKPFDFSRFYEKFQKVFFERGKQRES